MSFLATLEQRFGPNVIQTSEFRDNKRLVAPAAKIHDVLSLLRDDCGFDMLVDVTAVDYLHYPDARDRFGVIYVLVNTISGERVVVKTFVNDPKPTLPTCFDIWRGADWMEREVFDMFGIRFEGHPDLRRILLPEEFTAHPLRKDYPIRGKGERHEFRVLTRSEG